MQREYYKCKKWSTTQQELGELATLLHADITEAVSLKQLVHV